MAARRKKKHPRARRPKGESSSIRGFHTPFRNLDQHLGQRETATALSSGSSESPSSGEDGEIFLEAMADVTPLQATGVRRIPPPTPTRIPPRFLLREELEVRTHLGALVAGQAPFELRASDEYVEGFATGSSPKILKKLRNGDISYQDHIDLHGCNRSQARERVTEFIRRSYAAGRRCVLVVSGRGLNSKGKKPVLKHSLVQWLTQAPLKRVVLAFTSARPYDGGAGAFYVVLKRNRGKVSFIKSPLP